jgi:hypothetical protein
MMSRAASALRDRAVSARRGTITLATGGLAAVGFGGLAAAYPLSVAVVILVPLVILVPIVAVAYAVLADGIAFPLLLVGSTSTLVNIGVLIVVLVALPAVFLRRAANPAVNRVVLLILALAVPGVIIAIFTLPSAQWLSGIRYLVIPLAVAILGSALSPGQLRLLFKAVACLMVINLLAAGIETALGSDALLKLTNIGYGVSIRNFGTALRAPGTFATNYQLGAFTAVAAVIALVWWGTLKDARRDLPWRIVAVLSALGSLALSTDRTGVILVAVGVVAAVLFSGSVVKPWIKLGTVLLVVALVTCFFLIGLGDTQSFFQRLGVWSQLLAGPPALLGNGIGYSGAASGAAGSAAQIFTDNYYISLWLQFGIFGILISLVFVGILIALYRLGWHGNHAASVAASLLLGTLVAFFFVEMWEYTSAMSLVAVVVGASVAGVRRSRLP